MRLAVVQFKPRKGGHTGNLGQVRQLFEALRGSQNAADLLVFPETALTGYLLEGGVAEVAVTAGTLYEDLAETHRGAAAAPVDVAVGFYEEYRGTIYNSALYCSLGGPSPGILHVHRKMFLPTYGVFDEARFVASGQRISAFDTRFGRVAMLVCEDAWHSFTPAVAALQGAELLLVHSAAPARGAAPGEPAQPENVARWERLARTIAEEHGVWVAAANLAGFEGGKGFAGGSLIVSPRGDVTARGPLWDDALVEAELDFGEVRRARADCPMLADLRVMLPHLVGSLGDSPVSGGQGAARPDAGSVPVLPAAGADPLALDCALVERWLVKFLREEVATQRGFGDVVLGLSGGLDSAVVAHLAVLAFGPEHVHTFALPCRTSSSESAAHAALVAAALGTRHRVVDISAAVDGYLSGEPDADATRRGNVMARQRMIVLFDQSAALRALPLGTGNKTERLLGYFTWHGDDAPPINPIGDLFKTQVRALARHLGVVPAIIDKPPTADLVSGQTDEGDLGISYAVADIILHWLLRGHAPAALAAGGFAPADVELVRSRLDSTHWKRRQATVAMLSPTAIGEFYLRPVDYRGPRP